MNYNDEQDPELEDVTVYSTGEDDDELFDDFGDQPEGDDPLESDLVMLAGETPYTTADPPMTEDGTVLPEPIPDDNSSPVLPDKVAGIIRTVSPYIVGWLMSGLTWLVTVIGLDIEIPESVEPALWQAIPWVLGTIYYVLARYVLEKRWPTVPWLGSRKQPLYTPPVKTAAAIMPLASTGYVWYKGGRFSPQFRDMLVELDRLTPDVPIVITQGGFNGRNVSASAGTHAGDAVDISVRGLSEKQAGKLIKTARSLGLTAWFRTARKPKWGTRAQGFSSYHIHGVPNGWGRPSEGAKRQIAFINSKGVKHGYRYGRDGLASNGPDVGPGHVGTFRSRTWPGYLALMRGKGSAPAPAQQKKTPITPIPRHITPKPWMIIPENGYLNGLTISRLQWQLNIKPTGKLDHYTVRALKVWLGNTDDGKGILSPLHVKQLQYRVGFRGSAQDGKWGPVTTKALQRYLNANR